MRALTKIMLMAAFAILAAGCSGDDMQCVGCDDGISSGTAANNSSPSGNPNNNSSPSGGDDGQNSSSSGGVINDYYRYYDPYTTTAQRCQGGFVENKCGDVWYMPELGIDNNGVYQYQYCSSNELVKTEIRYERCGDLWYSPSSQRCQGSVVETKCGDDELWYNSQTQFCVSSKVVEQAEYFAQYGYERCGTTWYNPTSATQRCQNDVIENKCGDRWYSNSTTQVCHSETINGTASQTVIDKERCGASNFVIPNKCFVSGRTYNPETQFCYNGSQVLSKCNGSTYNPTIYFCYDNKRYSLCGYDDSEQEYNPETQRCSSGAVETKCGTGNNYHNPATEGCCGDNKYTISTQFCSNIDNGVYPLCGGSGGLEYNPETQRCQSGVVQTKCGTNYYNAETQFCIDNKVYFKCEGSEYNPETYYCKDGLTRTEYGSVVGNNGKSYKTVAIGTQIWMAENLNSGTSCYDNDPINCDKYGSLYNWATAMIACPTGWHLPSDAEWTVLRTFVGGSTTKLKANSSLWETNTGTDNYGFSALPGGYYASSSFADVGKGGEWWGATEYSDIYAYHLRMSYDNSNFNISSYGKGRLISVRCIKNN